jgi:apolipoprotein N-acyltransferase
MWSAVSFWGNWRIAKIEAALAETNETSHIGLVQPNFTFDELSSNKTRSSMAQDQSLDHLLKISEDFIVSSNPKLDLLVWPESVAPSQFAMSPSQVERTKDLVEKTGTPILAQATEFDREEIKAVGFRKATFFSTSFLLRPDRSRSSSYKKWIPMPFGEFVPFEDTFPALGEFLRDNVGNMSKVGRGTSYDSLAYSPKHFVAPLICFDAIDTELPRLQSKYGKANLFINQSNFVWMGSSNAGYQFKELVRFRAIENGRSAILAANTGPSVMFNPVGREITNTTPLLEPATLSAFVPIWRQQTFFNFCGDTPLQVAGAIGFIILGFAMSNVNKRKHRPGMLH